MTNKPKSRVAEFQRSEHFRLGYEDFKKGIPYDSTQMRAMMKEMKEILADIRQAQTLPNPIKIDSKSIETSVKAIERSNQVTAKTVQNAMSIIQNAKSATDLYYEIDQKLDTLIKQQPQRPIQPRMIQPPAYQTPEPPTATCTYCGTENILHDGLEFCSGCKRHVKLVQQ